MRNTGAGPGLGNVRGDYAVINPAMGAIMQILRAFLLIPWGFMLITTVVSPSAVDDNAVVTTVVVAAVYGLKLGWRALTATLGVNR
ncbi:hypothetical protein ACFQ6U_09720 [Streptomyces sp. NPDC056465]|uniref:hypothetical protein n=1 Tax=unclassified Streptomyces TaxID=2593676 RepID=UPI0035DBF888